MCAIVALAVVLLLPTLIIPALITSDTMLFLVTRNVLAAVRIVFHKVDPLAAGVVFVAVLAPMFGVARRYAQIDRWAVRRYPLDYYRLTIDHLWLRKVADVEPAIEAGLADADRDPNVGSECRYGGSGYRRCDQKTFHVESPVLRYVSSSRLAQLELLIAIPTSPLLLSPFWLARGVLALLSFFSALRSWRLLLTLV